MKLKTWMKILKKMHLKMLQNGNKLLTELRIKFSVISMVLVAALLTDGCKSKDPVVTYKTLQKDTTVVSNYSINDPDPLSKTENIRLIVSLISTGEGIDREAMGDINLHTKNVMTHIKKPIQYVLVFWGREGEVDVCFRLKNLNPMEQTAFIEDLKELFANRTLVVITENQPCNHIR